ncbi:MAG: hypothetical protein ACREFQ_03695 [Stellaceae bacterium]
MPFKPNYRQARSERRRAQEQRTQEKQQKRQENAAKRKAEREPPTEAHEAEPEQS